MVTYGFLLPIEFDLCFLELFPVGKEQFFQVDSRPLFGRPSPPRFPGTRFFICGAGLFCLGDDLHADIPVPVKNPQFVKGRDRKEIPVQQEQGIPKGKGGMVCIFRHLYYMGSARNSRTVPGLGSLQAIMEPDA